MDTIKQWWEGNSTRTWRSLVVLLFTAIVAMTSWGLAKVTEIPEKCVMKSDYECDKNTMQRTLERIENKTDEINLYLRNRGPDHDD